MWIADPPCENATLPEFYVEPERGPVSGDEVKEVLLDGLKNHELYSAERFASCLKNTVPAEPIYVESTSEFPNYYLVPLVKDGKIWAIGMVNADKGTFMGATCAEDGLTEYPLLSREKALAVLRQATKEDTDSLRKSLKLTWRPCQQSWLPYLPFWTVKAGGKTIHVGQDGKLYEKLT